MWYNLHDCDNGLVTVSVLKTTVKCLTFNQLEFQELNKFFFKFKLPALTATIYGRDISFTPHSRFFFLNNSDWQIT